MDVTPGFLRRMSGISRDEGDAWLLPPVTEPIIGCAFRVCLRARSWARRRGSENALAHQPGTCGIGVVQQRGSVVSPDDMIAREDTADLLVEDEVIVELKVVGSLSGVDVPRWRNDCVRPASPCT